MPLAHRTRVIILGEGNVGAFDSVLDAAMLSGLEERASEERATPLGNLVKGRQTTTSVVRLDTGVGEKNEAAVTGVDDDMRAGMNMGRRVC